MKVLIFMEVLLAFFAVSDFSCWGKITEEFVVEELLQVQNNLNNIKDLYKKIKDNSEIIYSTITNTINQLYPTPVERLAYSLSYIQRSKSTYKPELITRTYDFYSNFDKLNAITVDMDRLALQANEGRIRIKLLIEKVRPPFRAYSDPELSLMAKKVNETKILDAIKEHYRIIMNYLKKNVAEFENINKELQWASVAATLAKELLEDHPTIAENVKDFYSDWHKEVMSVIHKIADESPKLYYHILNSESQLQLPIRKSDVLHYLLPRENGEGEGFPDWLANTMFVFC